jgi:predicted AlkP superfamily pyrophosphatase or phosphodiesterase
MFCRAFLGTKLQIMKKEFFVMALLFVSLVSLSQNQGTQMLPRPKLVVGIVVDQMRWDYLYRFYDRYKPGGFKRILNEGFSCENTLINYLPTVTAIGHSTIYTGSVPAIHGIAGNDFLIEATGKNMYCTGDNTVATVGSTSNAGKMSPRNLLTTTIGDQLRLATNFKSKVISIALKDRASILPGGHLANAAYWFDSNGNWITSTYYMNELPAWVNTFNNKKLAEQYLKKDWNTLYPIETYVQSLADDNKYEGKFSGQAAPVFPVKTSEMFSRNVDIIRSTPYGIMLTAEMAKSAMVAENLGKGGATDFLAVSFSTPDYVGHNFNVNSIEVEDTYLRLDIELQGFLNFLDTKIGKGNYTLFLSADHGAGHNARFSSDNNIPAGYWQGAPVQKQLNNHLEEKFGVSSLVVSFSNAQVHLNHKAIENNKLNESDLRKEIVQFLRFQPHIAFVADVNNIEEAALPGDLKTRIINGYNASRSGPIVFLLEAGWYGGGPNTTGSTHGTWNNEDAHIPLLWMGWGINHGSISRRTNMTDISATLASLLHIQMPNGCIGEPVQEALKKF